MIASRSTTPLAPHAEYRRLARRIRRAFATQPGLRLQALCELARRTDADAGGAELVHRIRTLPPGAARTFADVVRARMDGPLLRYSQRQRLLRDAEQRGIGRFEANLVIAAVQHEAGATPRQRERVALPCSWIPAAIAFTATQSLVALAAWWLTSG